MLCIKDGIYDLYKENKDWKIFRNKESYIAIYYDFPSFTLNQLVEELNQIKGNKKLYCFSMSEKADKILVINQGEIVESGTHQELVDIPNGLYQKLYQLQSL